MTIARQADPRGRPVTHTRAPARASPWPGRRPPNAIVENRTQPAAWMQAVDTRGRAGVVEYGLEVVVLPVSDTDKAKDFYQGLGWRLDADFAGGPDGAT